ncbi:class A beta-lactamase [Sphingopyxis sp. KK2]|uniref:class A beta-lactamase n=1 Tax=Sphingopyxis sp. KK2 TaxID=1855727 RepID=UPI002117DBA3|nr:class A beta-lactamase [Sphingopyxis sp. KK2]
MRALLVAALLLTAACSAVPPEPGGDTFAFGDNIRDIEKRSGGRLGIAVVKDDGQLLFGSNANDRFAMCSTFKLLLAGQVLRGATDGGPSLRTPLPLTKADIVPHSPYSEANLALGELRLGLAAEQIVTVSDNAAANLILKATGGPEAFTRRMRDMGDAVTRLDRYEIELNENAVGDPRDTTTPQAMAKSAARLVYGDHLDPSYRKSLREWMVASKTGLARIRAGLPAGWLSGDKTGSCGNAYNDVAFVEAPDGGKYVIAVYLDRPVVEGEAANAVIADVTRAVVEDLSKL